MKKIIYLNSFIKITLILGGIVFSISKILDKDLYGVLIRLSIIPLALLPNIVKKKIKITERIEVIYLLFLFIAHFLGSIVNLYYQISWYDTFVHYMSGWITASLGYIICVKACEKNNKFISLFLLTFSSLIAVMWEIFEFTCDLLFHKDAQNVLTTGVTDTMTDLIVALFGCITVLILSYLEGNHKRLFISSFKREIKEVYGKNLE